MDEGTAVFYTPSFCRNLQQANIQGVQCWKSHLSWAVKYVVMRRSQNGTGVLLCPMHIPALDSGGVQRVLGDLRGRCQEQDGRLCGWGRHVGRRHALPSGETRGKPGLQDTALCRLHLVGASTLEALI